MNTPKKVNRLVNDNFGLAKYWAGKYQRQYGYNEALSLAMKGLLHAAERYQDNSGPRFGTFASIHIKWTFGAEYHRLQSVKRGEGMIPISIDGPAYSSDSMTTVGQTIVDENAETAVDAIQTSESLQEVESLLSLLPRRDRNIVEMRFGIGGKGPCLLEEIAIKYGMTRERVRQIVDCALRKFWRLKHRKKLVAVTAADLQAVG